MPIGNNESRIPNIDSELEKAEAQKDRKRVKLLLNNLWWQIKENLEQLPTETRKTVGALFDQYGKSKHFGEIAEKVKDPNRIVETLQTASVKMEDEKTKVAWSKRMVRRANGAIEEVDDKSE